MAGGLDEHDTCREYVRPALALAGWREAQIHEQFPVMADLPAGRAPAPRDRKRRADYVLELEPGLPLVVIEAKREWAAAADGIQQATRYATKLDVPLALSTNGTGWVLYNAQTGQQQAVNDVPTPEEAWDLLVESKHLGYEARDLIRAPFNRELVNADGSVKQLRYYQRRAVHEALSALAAGQQRVLVVMATGSGKTFTALQLVWKQWSYRRHQQQTSDLRNYRVLYLADRGFLVSGPLDRNFRGVFRDATTRVSSGDIRHSPDIYFATYQGLSVPHPEDGADADPAEGRDLLENYPADFFDLVIIDECHRGSARAESEWRGILDHFEPAAQLGLTATPIERGGVDTFDYFGNPVFEYSLAEGIADGFLAPYTIRRVVFDVDADGVEVVAGQRDVSGRVIPGGIYGTRDFERKLVLPDRTRAMARRISDVVGDTRDRAVVFCVDAAHAATMAAALRNLRPDRTASEPEWVSRIMSVEREKIRLLKEFTDPERDVPQIAVTSSLLSTGVDIEDLKYVVICRRVGSMAEFKQIIGRGTRLYPEKGKTEFEIIDFVGATDLFRDPAFDGPPLKPPRLELVDPEGGIEADVAAESGGSGNPPGGPAAVGQPAETIATGEAAVPEAAGGSSVSGAPTPPGQERFELDGVAVTLTSEGFWVHDTATGRPRLVNYIDWVGERVLAAYENPHALLRAWADPRTRSDVVTFLGQNRVDVARLAEQLGSVDGAPVDTVDHLLHLAWDLPTLTRAERARRARSEHQADLDALPARARTVLRLLLDRYAEQGVEEIASPAVVQVPPVSDLGSPTEIAGWFGGPVGWHQARQDVQRWLYSA